MNQQQFEQGLTFTDYLSRIEKNKQLHRQVYDEIQIPGEDVDFYRGLGPMNVMVIAEDWCPDVVHNLPIVAKVSDQAPNLTLRIFFRDANPELMDQYLTNGNRAIPVVVFFDEKSNEVARWVRRPAKAQVWLDKEVLKGRKFQDVPKSELAGLDKKMAEKYRKEFRQETLMELRQVLGRQSFISRSTQEASS
ncbi:MAG: thioredoxin family protein [bacterium]